ncbi:MAG: DNA repair protein RadA [Kineosporiaceae bacterium]
MSGGRRRTVGYECTACGATSAKWVGRCGGCGGWGTVEQAPESRPGPAARTVTGPAATPLPITDVPLDRVSARPSGIGELDRVLGGGVVPGAVVLLAGEPGVGKSTLLLELSAATARAGGRVLYATGEESAAAVHARARRVRADVEGVFVVEARTMPAVAAAAEDCRPGLVVVDSVQVMTTDEVDGAPGSVTQVRAVAEAAGVLARRTAATTLLVGHVTKDGSVAGPRTLEHLVDVVCLLEGDRHARLRLLRAVKNRHGPTDEVGCFELDDEGMTEVADPSGAFLSGRSPAPGSCVTVSVEGRRPVAVEVQTLVAPATGSPRRVTSGLDASRVAMVQAVVERRAGVPTPAADVYAATVGGLRLSDPGVDLALAVALAGSVHDVATRPSLVVVGEVGLGGEVRTVPALPRRLSEAARLGFRTAVVPAGTGRAAAGPNGLRVVEVATVAEALLAALPGTTGRSAAGRRVTGLGTGSGRPSGTARTGQRGRNARPSGRVPLASGRLTVVGGPDPRSMN